MLILVGLESLRCIFTFNSRIKIENVFLAFYFNLRVANIFVRSNLFCWLWTLEEAQIDLQIDQI